jgi:hypothetical protein
LKAEQSRDWLLRDLWTGFLSGNVHNPIFVTIQPNTAWGRPMLVKTPGCSAPVARMWAATETLMWRLDRRLTGCPKPSLLPPRHRLQGYAIIEKALGNIHCHMLISCEDTIKQVLTANCLFEAIDTAPDRRWDHHWQKDVWETLVRRGEVKDVGRTRTLSPFLNGVMPSGTATVQIVRTAEDRDKVFRYVTKELGGSTLALATTSEYWASRADLNIKSLAEWHAPIPEAHYASNVRIDPISRSQTLNLDDPHPWKARGKTLR